MGSDSSSNNCVVDVMKVTNFRCRVSSVLNKDVKNYGKDKLFDGSEETCWNSDQGSPQWIMIDFEEPQLVDHFEMQFQGGFAAVNLSVKLTEERGTEPVEQVFYPEDVNSLQTFKFKHSPAKTCSSIKFLFCDSTDFFGRIVLYNLRLLSSVDS